MCLCSRKKMWPIFSVEEFLGHFVLCSQSANIDICSPITSMSLSWVTTKPNYQQSTKK